MIRSVVSGLVIAVVVQLIALPGFLVGVGVFGASPDVAAKDAYIYIAAAILSTLWGYIASVLPSLRPRLAVLSFIVSWATIGVTTFGLTAWWLLSIAVVAVGAVLGLLVFSAVKRRRRDR